jgi:ABC-2 type transport system ATP-binding protein
VKGAWAVETHDLTKRYGDFEAVNALNLRVPRGQITGFLGRNGAGKSTTIRMLLGMIAPTRGAGLMLGRRIENPKENREMRRDVAYVAEDKQAYAYMTVEQMIRFTRSFYTDWHPEIEQKLLKQYQLPLRRKVKALSKGMRTKLSLLLALARHPALLILDEPSEGLDPVSIEELLHALVVAAGDGTTVFFSSHQITEVERVAERVCILDRGLLAMDFSLDQLRQDYRRVTLGFSTQPPQEAFRVQGIEKVRTDGRQMTLLVSSNAERIAERARSMAAVSVDVGPVSLREIFLEAVVKDDE